MKKLLCITLTFVLTGLGSIVLAQPGWQQTGLIDALIDGRPFSFATSSSKVPEDAAEGVENENVRAMLEKLAGTTQHTATWMITEPFEMGGMILLPAQMFASLDASAKEIGGTGEFRIEFGLVQETLTLNPEADIDIRYYPESWSVSEFYALTEGTMLLERVEVVDGQTLAMYGTISGVLSFQPGYSVEHNPDDTLPIEASFSIEQVVGSQLLLEMLGQ
jgi:hypothetical protein